VGQRGDVRDVAGLLAERGDHDLHDRRVEGAPLRTRRLPDRAGRRARTGRPRAGERLGATARVRRRILLAARPARLQYSKGALFLANLRETLGEAAFWKGLRSFTRAHAGKTVTSMDLQRAMERASGRDLSSDFAAWVFE